MTRDVTSIEIKRSTWKRLNRRKDPGDTFDEVVQGLLDAAGPEPSGGDEQPQSASGPTFECPGCPEGYDSYEALKQHMNAAGH